MKKIIVMLCLLLAGCSVQTPVEEDKDNSAETIEPERPDIPLESEEETEFMGESFRFEKVDLPVATYDGKPSETYLYKNRPEIIDDLNGLSYTVDDWGYGKQNSLNDEKISVLNVMHTILYNGSYIYENKTQANYFLVNIFSNYPETLIEDAYLKGSGNDGPGNSMTDELHMNGKTYTLDYPTNSPSLVYSGEKVRKLYQRLYNQPCPVNESTRVLLAGECVTYSYDKNADVFTYYLYGDGASIGFDNLYLYMLDESRNGDEIEFKVAAIYYGQWEGTDNTVYYKNSGLPILERHFSDESRSDGKLTLSEMMKDQKENLDIYKVRAKINEDGTYTMIDYENMTPMHEAKDVIFYMNYACERGDDSQLLPLFDVSYAYEANNSLIHVLFNGNRNTGFYEDDKNAVIWIENGYSDNFYNVYVVDKINHEMKKAETEDSPIYQKFMSVYTGEINKFSEMMVFDMENQLYLFYDGKFYKVTQLGG